MRKSFKIFAALLLIVGVGAGTGIFLYREYQFSRPNPMTVPFPEDFDPAKIRAKAQALQQRLEQLAALRARAEKDPAEAIGPLRDFIGGNAGTQSGSEARYILAQALGATKDVDGAVRELEALAGEADPDSRLFERACLLEAQLLAPYDEAAPLRTPTPQDIRARKALERALKSPQHDLAREAHLACGLLDLTQGRYRQAVDHLRRGVKVLNGKEQAIDGLRRAILSEARQLEEKGDWAGVIDWTAKMVALADNVAEISPVRHVLLFRRARALREQGDFTEARVILERLRALPQAARKGEIDCDRELAALSQDEEAKGIVRTPAAFQRALAAGTEKRAHFEGEVAADAAWGQDRSPLVLTGLVTVKPGATLTIEPGVVVQTLLGAGIRVEGALVAAGTADKPVRLTSGVLAAGARSFFDGEGIKLVKPCAADKCRLEHLVVEHQRVGVEASVPGLVLRACTFARNGERAVALLPGAAATVEGSTFDANDGAAVVADDADLTLRGCRVTGNGREGVLVRGQLKATIENNRIEANGAQGGAGIACETLAAVTIQANAVARNAGNGILLSGRGARTVRGNHVIENGAAGIRCEHNAAPTIEGNLIEGSKTNGVSLQSSSGEIRANQMRGNRPCAVQCAEGSSARIEGNYLIGSGILVDRTSSSVMTGNTIPQMDPPPITNEGTATLSAPNNYYGNATDQKLDEMIPRVDWRPRLTEKPPAPPIPDLKGLP